MNVMQIGIHSQGVGLSDSLTAHATERLMAALDRHARRIENVNVRLSDVNGPRGGMDKACEVIVDLHRRGRIVVTEIGDDLYSAITQAAHRTKGAVTRAVERSKPQWA